MWKKLIAIGCFIALVCVIGGGYIVNRFAAITSKLKDVSERVAYLEGSIKAREQADPLIASECSVEPDLGDSRDRPCRTTFDRLLLAPEKFHGRWIQLSGLYASRFEESALYSLSYKETDPIIFQHHSAVWVNPVLQVNGLPPGNRMIIGKFHNGPSGHLSAYFGKLDDASDVTEKK